MAEPICGFDLSPQRAAPATGVDHCPAAGFACRWLHLDVAAPGFADWAAAHLPPLAAETLPQTEAH